MFILKEQINMNDSANWLDTWPLDDLVSVTERLNEAFLETGELTATEVSRYKRMTAEIVRRMNSNLEGF